MEQGCAQSSPGCLARACTSHASARDAGERPRFQHTQPSRGGQSEPNCQGGRQNALGRTQGPLPNKHRVSVSSTLWPPVPHRPAPCQGPFVSTAGCAAQAGGPTGEGGAWGLRVEEQRGLKGGQRERWREGQGSLSGGRGRSVLPNATVPCLRPEMNTV